MITEIRKNLYRIEVPLKGNPLRALNSYFIKSPDRELLIDTGFLTDDCYEALSQALKELNSNADIRDVCGTHLHADHIGFAHKMVGKGRHIFMSKPDYYYMRHVGDSVAESNARLRTEGFTEEWIVDNTGSNAAWKYDICIQPEELFQTVEDGEIIEVGEYKLKVVFVPGHTPGQMMLWDEEHKIMFTADNVLFDITPNITNFATIEDSLGNYLESLKKADTYPVELALPGHRETGDYHKRIAELLKHHEVRLNEVVDIIKNNPGFNAVEIASRMTWSIRVKGWDDFPSAQKWYATGECMSHLDYLRLRGKITRKMVDGTWQYYIV